MVSTYFLFTQLMLAVVYNAYQENLKDQLKDFHTLQTKGLALAFSMLSTPGEKEAATMCLDTFKDIIKRLVQFPKLTKSLPWYSMEFYFKALDDGTGELTFLEFREACDVLLFSYHTTPDASLL